MATDCIPPLTLKFQQKMKPVVARFGAEHVSTDGGTLLLKALDERLTLTEDLAACLPAQRDPRKVQHALRDLLRQRVFGLACGYEDCHDAARLADYPMHKLAVARDMWEPYSNATLDHVPDAAGKIVFDRFHVMGYVGNAVDTVRKQEHRDLMASGDETLKGRKYLWLYSRENVPERRRDAFQRVRHKELKVGRP